MSKIINNGVIEKCEHEKLIKLRWHEGLEVKTEAFQDLKLARESFLPLAGAVLAVGAIAGGVVAAFVILSDHVTAAGVFVIVAAAVGFLARGLAEAEQKKNEEEEAVFKARKGRVMVEQFNNAGILYDFDDLSHRKQTEIIHGMWDQWFSGGNNLKTLDPLLKI